MAKRCRIAGLVCLSVLASRFCCGQHGSERTRGEHLIAVVPLIGAGTPGDPKRPMFIPNPADAAAALASGRAPQITAFHFELTDDGQNAIVEFVASNRQSLGSILSAQAAGSITVFDPHTAGAASVVQQLRLLKKDFSFQRFHGPVGASQLAQGAALMGGSN